MILLKSDNDIKIIKEAMRIGMSTIDIMTPYIKPGITTQELDDIAKEYILSQKAESSFYGYKGFPRYVCISINEEICHGIPKERIINDGDIVSVDVGIKYEGLYSDQTETLIVGSTNDRKEKLLQATRGALYSGIAKAFIGNTVDDISKAIYNVAYENHMGVVTALTGHGVGFAVHEEPKIPNKPNGNKLTLVKGIVIAIEPMFTLGSGEVSKLQNGTVVSKDGTLSAHFERTVIIGEIGK